MAGARRSALSFSDGLAKVVRAMIALSPYCKHLFLTVGVPTQNKQLALTELNSTPVGFKELGYYEDSTAVRLNSKVVSLGLHAYLHRELIDGYRRPILHHKGPIMNLYAVAYPNTGRKQPL